MSVPAKFVNSALLVISLLGPLNLGVHRIRLTATDGAATSSPNRTIALNAATMNSLTLREAAGDKHFLIGAEVGAQSEFNIPNPLMESAYTTTLAGQYNMLSPGNSLKWPAIHPSKDAFDFSQGDAYVSFARAHQMEVRGHTLTWHLALPNWLSTFARDASATSMAELLKDHITTVVGHYRGQVFAWDVVNEAISDSASGTGTALRDSVWFNGPGIGTTGTGYIEQAFRWAHDADPNALLFYNEYGVEAPGNKFNAMFNMLEDFISRGVPVHGVGLQMHVTATGSPSASGLSQNITALTSLGLQVHITEMDVRVEVDSMGRALPIDLQSQARRYREILTVCLEHPGCTAFQTWGFTDKYSWIPSYYNGFGAALPFDENYQPKPVLDALVHTLKTVPR